MTLATQKRISAKIMKVGKNRVKFDAEHLKEIKEAITRADIKSLIDRGIISKKSIKSISRGRYRASLEQKRKGRQKGPGKRRGTLNARSSKKKKWIAKIRPQRKFLKMLKEKNLLSNAEFWNAYLKIKGNFFRSRAHLKLYIEKTLKKTIPKGKPT